MKHIINFFAVLIFVAVLSGCIAKKKTVRTEIEKKDVLDSICEKVDYTNHTWSIEDFFSELYKADRVGHLVIYDTDKPIDSITGRPPVKAEADFSETVQRNVSQSKDSVFTEEERHEEMVQVKDSLEIKVKTEEVVDNTPWYRKNPFRQIVLLITLSLGLLVVFKLNIHKILLKWLANIF